MFNTKHPITMSDDMNSPITKIYTDGRGNGGWFNGASDFASLLIGGILGAAMNGNGGGLFGGGNNAQAAQQYASLQGQINENAANSAMMDAINGAAAANGTGQASILGAVNGLASAFQTGCCECKSAILESGYQNQLANCQQTNTILQQSQGLQNTMQNGFTNIGFLLERNACDVKENSTANTQRIIDTLNNHWSLEQQTTIQQLRDEVGRLNQTASIIAALKPASTTA